MRKGVNATFNFMLPHDLEYPLGLGYIVALGDEQEATFCGLTLVIVDQGSTNGIERRDWGKWDDSDRLTLLVELQGQVANG